MTENKIEMTEEQRPLSKQEQKALEKQKKEELKRLKKEKKLYEKDKIHKVKTITPMQRLVPYIMETRNTSQNFIFDRISMPKVDEYIKKKQSEGLVGFSVMHVILAAYVRAVSQRPAINRFIRGQKIYSRKKIEISLVVKKEMTLESPDTVIKVIIDPAATADDVYRILNSKIEEYRAKPNSKFDKLAKALNFIPGILLRWTIRFLRFLDYCGLLPKFLTKLSPFHASLFITSMGSLGVPPIIHHLYDFGTVPAFIAFGSKQRELLVNEDGSVMKHSYTEITYNLDERICDGFYYASALKVIRNCFKHPECLDNPPEQVIPDVK